MTLLRRSPGVLTFVLAGLLSLAAAESRAECSASARDAAEQSYSTAYQFVQADQWADAIPSLETAVSACPEHWPSVELMAQAKMRTSQWADAVDYYERLVKGQYGSILASAGQRVLEPFGYVLLKNRGFNRAEQVYEAILRIDPNNIKAHERLVYAYDQTGSLRNAIDHLQILYGLTSGEDKAKYAKRIGNAYNKLGDSQTAKQWFETAGGGASGLFTIGVEHMNDKEWAEAERAFEKFLEGRPESVAAMKNLGQCLTAQREHTRAIEVYEKALEVDPSRHDIAASLGFAYSELGRWGDAGRLASRALENWEASDPHLGSMQFLMGKVYEKRDGNYEQAIAMFEKARDDSYWGDQAIKEIDRQRQLIEIREMKANQG